jgi:hypothetical protein
MRRVALVAVPIAAVLGLAACGSDGETAASSSPSTTRASSTTAATLPTTTVLPGSTAVGQPIPIGQETTAVATTAGDTATTTADGGSAGPGDSTGATTGTTTAGQPGVTTTSAAGTATTVTIPEPVTTPGPNAGTPFCAFNSEVEDAGDGAVDDAAFIVALRNDLYPRMGDWIAEAPTNDLRAAATTMRDATKQAIEANNVDPFDSDEATEALLKIHLFCG